MTAVIASSTNSKETPLSEKLFWISGAALLFLSNYHFQQFFNVGYRISLVLTGLLCICSWRLFTCVTFSRYTLWMFIALFIIGIFTFASWGDRVSKTFYHFERAIPLFYLGFSISRSHYARQIVLGSLMLGFTITSLLDIYLLRHILGDPLIREQMAVMLTDELQGSDDIFNQIQNFIYYFPVVSFLCILLIGLLHENKTLLRIILIICLAIMSLMVFISTWTAAMLVLLIGFAIIILLPYRRNPKIMRRRRLIMSAALVGLFCLMVFYTADFNIYGASDSAKIATRIRAIPLLITNPSSFFLTMDDISGTRVSLVWVSLSSFFDSPFLGVGDDTHSDVIGGHSFWFDSLARYGIVGFIPLALMITSWSYWAAMNFKYNMESYMDRALFAFFITFVLSNIFNPYLFTSMLDLIVFLAAGIVCGKNFQFRRRVVHQPQPHQIAFKI